jgi:hypothetical protein
VSTLYDNGRAYQNSWIVYINGLQVPVAAVQTSHGVWQIPEAAVQMVPDPVLQRLGAEDRVQVQAFYCDQWFRSPPEFCLLFDGEIVAWSYVSTTNSRSISFSCVDYTQILTQLFFFFMSSFDDIAVGVSGAAIGVQGSTVQLAGFGALYPYSLFTQGLADTSSTGDTGVISRPIDFAYNIVRALIKADHPNRTVPGANFFAPWAKRTNYHKRWIALPYVDADPSGTPGLGVFPILRAKQAEEALAAVARKASNVGSQGSMWDMLGEVLKTMMMEIAMIPTPAAVRSDFRSLLPKGPVDGNADNVFLTNYFVKPQFLFGLPPACNVFFPPQISDYAYNENYITQPTRMYFNEETILSYLNRNATPNGVNSVGASLMQDALCTAYPEEVDNAARAAVHAEAQNGKNLLVYPEEFFKGPVIDRRAMPSWFVFLQQSMQGATGAENATEDSADASDVEGNSVESPGEVGTRTATSGEDLSGATHAVFWKEEVFRRLITTMPGRGALISVADQRNLSLYRSPAAATPGPATPPQVFPLLDPQKTAGFGDTFFAARPSTANNGGRIHAGHDIAVPDYETKVVSTVPGKVVRIRTYDHHTNRTQWQGNAVHIEDEHGALHQYMHLESIDKSIFDLPRDPQTERLTTPYPVTARQVIGVAGNSGRGRARGGAGGKHLHYDVTTKNGYRLNYSDRLRRLRRGRGFSPASTETTTAPAASPPSSPNVARADNSSGDTEQNIFQLYAAYEYYKERYARRQGAVSMPFNPYPVAGFPCATFDRRSSSVDTMGYIMSVRHTLTTQSWSTDVAFSHGRTLQEMFSLMQRQAAYENARLGLRQQEISQAVESRQITNPNEVEDQTADAALAGIALPGGPIATAPAEPIPEIRALIQDFTRADEFYKAVFYHGPSPGADVLTAEQALRTSTTTATAAVPFVTADQVAATAAAAGETVVVNGRRTTVLNSATEQVLAAQGAVAGTVNQGGGRSAPTTAAALTGGGVFRYPDIIDLITPTGNRVGIQIQGYDPVTRDRLLGLIDQIRTGNVENESELDLFEQAFGSTVVLPNPGEPISEELHRFLNAREYELRSTPATVNVSGDVTIVPRESAEGLFSDFATAMAYNGRPVCTLEEYIAFLGPDGLREGLVDPQTASVSRDVQLHPAPFYTRIRRFRAGPPLTRPRTNITNTPTVTDAPAGQEQVPVEDATNQGATATFDVAGIPADFPDTRANWDAVLELYRRNVLAKLSPNS